MAGKLEAEIYAEKGMGYEMIENREKREKEIGLIEVDSIFTPVLRAGIKIENVRVGKLTNYDKLILDIKTDGTITPEEAFSQAVKILIDQFSVLIIGRSEEKEESTEEAAKEIEEEIEEVKEEVEEEGEKKKRGRPKKKE